MVTKQQCQIKSKAKGGNNSSSKSQKLSKSDPPALKNHRKDSKFDARERPEVHTKGQRLFQQSHCLDGIDKKRANSS